MLALLVVGHVSTANAYQLSGPKWPQPSTTFYVDIPGEAGLWNDSFETAMFLWSVDTVFQFYVVRGTFSDPCNASDSRNGVRFDLTDCGDAWGRSTLAVTHFWYIGSRLTEADIVFNANEPWDVYSAPWQFSVYDFQRVAAHELGHALGLGHEDRIASTIMRSIVGDITSPQQDDINGVAAIYGIGTTMPPVGITVPSSDTDGSYTVTWASSVMSGVTYELQEATNNTFTAGLRTVYMGTALSTTVNGRANGSTYFYRVKASKFAYTDSIWVTSANGCTVSYNFAQSACASVDGNIDVFIPCVDNGGQLYQVTLIAHPDQSLPIGYYWSLGPFSQTVDNGTCASFDSGTLAVNFPCLTANGVNYTLTLDHYKNLAAPTEMFWSLGFYQPHR